jgi:hypothetical protein
VPKWCQACFHSYGRAATPIESRLASVPSLRDRAIQSGDSMKLYRDIATLSGLQVLCFLLLSHLEPDFFLLHFYQTIVYLAILIMLFYMEDRWAYMIGIVAPAVWLLMAFATGLLGGAARQIFQLGRGHGLTNLVSFLAGVSAVFSLLMIAACARRWKKEYAGLGKSLSTFAVSLGIVVVYYGILAAWFWHMIPFVTTQH